MDITKFIGKAIAYYREQKGWTTTQLANETGLSQGSISLYENGKRNPSDEAIDKIVSSLGIDLDILVTRAKIFSNEKADKVKEANPYVYSEEIHRERIRRKHNINRFSDLVFELNPDVIVSINATVHDLIENVSYNNRRPVPPSVRRNSSNLLAHLVEKVFKDFLNDNKDEIAYRMESELEKININAYQLIDELRNK
jgi:transcriptional regulator with XRE-family HTH domain